MARFVEFLLFNGEGVTYLNPDHVVKLLARTRTEGKTTTTYTEIVLISDHWCEVSHPVSYVVAALSSP